MEKGTNGQINWVDRDAMILAIVLSIAIWVPIIYASLRMLQEKNTLGLVIIFIIVGFYLGNGHWLAVRIKNNKIFLARGSFPSFRQRGILFTMIKSISISKAKKLDEMPGRGGVKMNFIRVIDIDGRKYRNVIILKNEFKQIIHALYDKGILNKNISLSQELNK